MRRKTLYALLPMILLTSSASLRAQSAPADEAAVIAAAVTHMMDTLRVSYGARNGAIGFEPRVVETSQYLNRDYSRPLAVYELTGTRADSITAEVFARLRATAGDFDHARVCATESLRTCTLRDHVALFASSRPVVVGDSAEVIVKALWLGVQDKHPVEQGEFLVAVRRGASGWKALASRGLNIVF